MPDVPEPKLSPNDFEQRCRKLAIQFNTALDRKNGEILFIHEITDATAIINLRGRSSEYIARNRGLSHWVIRLCDISDGICAWIGFRERWTRSGREKTYGFEEGGFTLHVGRVGEPVKPQIMRSEWIGRRSRSFTNLAGHPHWQLDILESARAKMPPVPARFGDAGEPGSPRFGEIPPAGASMLLNLTIERMHLASAAPWWRKPEVPIATSPANVEELDRWIVGCICYLRQEVKRCSIVSDSADWS